MDEEITRRAIERVFATERDALVGLLRKCLVGDIDEVKMWAGVNDLVLWEKNRMSGFWAQENGTGIGI